MRVKIETAARLVTVVAIAVLAGSVLAGCKASPRQAIVTKAEPVESTSTITPLQRGEIRREALRSAEKALDAWFANDLEAMRPYFSDQQYERFVKNDAEYRKEGKVRVRKHERLSFDANDMSGSGNEVSIRYVFTDKSYFKSTSGKQLSQPKNDEAEIQIGMSKVGDQWVVIRMITNPERLQ